jgi:hypothetical protein
MAVMRHSGRVIRPPGAEYPAGLMPDRWGFGSSHGLVVLLRPPGRRDRPAAPELRRPHADPVAALLCRIGKLFA